MAFVARRDGVVSLAMYGATTATTLLCSAFLGLAESATYSVMLQFATAIYNLSSAYLRSCLPMFQSTFVRNDKEVQLRTVDRGIACYVGMYLIGTIGVAVVFLPILTLFKEDFICDQWLYIGLSMYFFLLNQHSLYCQLIVSMNEIPYFKMYIVSTAVGIALSCLFCGVFHMETWGLVLGQAIPQLCYNNWHWPQYVYKKIGGSYVQSLKDGASWWVSRLIGRNKV